MRVLCRFLEDCYGCTELSRAIPRQSSRRVTIVETLPREHITELIQTVNPKTSAGLRNRALLLLAARTGLRPIDMVGLRLGDIDWQQGQITVTQHKTGVVLRLSLLSDVGEAIADYLLHGRPHGVADDHVFLRTQAPFIALSPSHGLYYVAADAMARTEAVSQHTMHSSRGFQMVREAIQKAASNTPEPAPIWKGDEELILQLAGLK